MNKWTVNRILDTLNKYSNHQILSIEQSTDYIELVIEYISEKHNSKTKTKVHIFADEFLK